MTITVDLPEGTVKRLEEYSSRTGKGIDELAAAAVISKYPEMDETQALFNRIAARVPNPGYVEDLS